MASGVEEPKVPTLVCECCGAEVLRWPGETMERARKDAERAFAAHQESCSSGGWGGYRVVEKERNHRR